MCVCPAVVDEYNLHPHWFVHYYRICAYLSLSDLMDKSLLNWELTWQMNQNLTKLLINTYNNQVFKYFHLLIYYN